MPYSTINGSSTYSSSAYWNEGSMRTAIDMPLSRISNAGTRPMRITAIGAYISGRFAARTIFYVLNESQVSGNFGIPNVWAGAHYALAGVGFNIADTNATRSLSFGFNNVSGGSVWTSTRYAPGRTIFSSFGSSPNTSPVGGFDYIEVPTAPGRPTLSGQTNSSFVMSWSGPSDNGGSGITGYRIQHSTSSNFSSNVTTIDVGTSGVSPRVISGLQPATTYYVRVLAQNRLWGDVGSNAGSPWSATASIATLINPPRFTDNTLGPMKVNQAYSDSVVASTIQGTITYPCTYRLSAGILPSGLSLNTSTGLVSGTPITAAFTNGPVYVFSIEASNAGGRVVETFTRTVLSEDSDWTDNTLEPDLRVAVPYSDQVAASGDQIVYTIQSGSLPPGILLTNTVVSASERYGVLSGTPTTPGDYVFTIRATNSSAGFVEQQFALTVKPTGRRFTSETESVYLSEIRRYDRTTGSLVPIKNIKRWNGSAWVNLTGV
jgi:hypothetical protein